MSRSEVALIPRVSLIPSASSADVTFRLIQETAVSCSTDSLLINELAAASCLPLFFMHLTTRIPFSLDSVAVYHLFLHKCLPNSVDNAWLNFQANLVRCARAMT